MRRLDRRDVVTWLGVGVIAAPALAADSSAETKPDSPSAKPSSSNEPLPFRSLEPGLKLYGVWEVEQVHSIEGAVAVHLRDGAHQFRLNVLKRDDAGIPGVGQSRSLSVYVCNNGGQTQEREGQAARALGEWLEHYEATGLPVPALKTLRQHARAQL